MNFSIFTTVLQVDLKQYLKWPIERQSKVLKCDFSMKTWISQIIFRCRQSWDNRGSAVLSAPISAFLGFAIISSTRIAQKPVKCTKRRLMTIDIDW